MATMHPIDIENYQYTASEKQMYDALKEQLPDKYQVFYSVRWFETGENNRRIDSESDFIIFDPSFGFLAIEVKGGEGIEIVDGDWYLDEIYENGDKGRRQLKCSPYAQAEKSMRHFHSYFVGEFNQNFNGVYGFAVAFPRFSVNQQLAPEAVPELTIDLNDMSNLRNRINNIFHYWKNKRNITIPFSAEQRQRFISVVNKQISLGAAAGALIPLKEKEFSKINFVQDSILDCLYNYRQVQIVGGAGTGKTFIAMKKAVRDYLYGKKVLFICCNKELSKFVSRKFEGTYEIDSCTYDEMMLRLLGEKYELAPLNENGNRCCFELLENIPEDLRYDSIIVDEAQDFDLDMGLSVRMLLRSEENSDLYVFYDRNQNIFATDFENAFAISTPPYVLRYNIRNTGCIYRCAVERTNLGSDTVANTIEGVQPETHNYSKRSQAVKALTNIVNRLVQKEHVDTKAIVVVSDVPYQNSILAYDSKIGAYDISFGPLDSVSTTEICFKTVSEFKGLESNIVIYLKHSFEDIPETEITQKREYVALTRARYYLYILTTKCKAELGE